VGGGLCSFFLQGLGKDTVFYYFLVGDGVRVGKRVRYKSAGLFAKKRSQNKSAGFLKPADFKNPLVLNPLDMRDYGFFNYLRVRAELYLVATVSRKKPADFSKNFANAP
jgi:hypothetical protein